MPAAEIAVQFTYEAKIIEPRKRSMKHVFVRDVVRTKVAEADAGDVVARIGVDVPARRIGEAPMRIDLRHGEGRFWRPVYLRTTPAGEPAVATLGLCAEVGDGPAMVQAWPDMQQLGSMKPLASLDGPDIKEILWNTREQRREAARKAGANARLMGGVLHRAVSEPVYFASEKGAVFSAFLADAVEKTPPSRIWAANDEQPLLDYALTVSAARQDVVLDQTAIEVIRPDLLTWDRDREREIAGVDMLLDRLHADLMNAPAKIAMSWVKLRELSRGRRRRDPETLDAARALAAECRTHGLARKHIEMIETELTANEVRSPAP